MTPYMAQVLFLTPSSPTLIRSLTYIHPIIPSLCHIFMMGITNHLANDLTVTEEELYQTSMIYQILAMYLVS